MQTTLTEQSVNNLEMPEIQSPKFIEANLFTKVPDFSSFINLS